LFKTKLVLRSILFVPIMRVAFVLAYALFGLVVPGARAVGVLLALAVVGFMYWAFVVSPIKDFGGGDFRALRTSGFTGGPVTPFAGKRRFARKPRRPALADIQWWEPHLVAHLDTLLESDFPSPKGLVLGHD
jgi:hypothetical protein